MGSPCRSAARRSAGSAPVGAEAAFEDADIGGFDVDVAVVVHVVAGDLAFAGYGKGTEQRDGGFVHQGQGFGVGEPVGGIGMQECVGDLFDGGTQVQLVE